MTLAQPPLNVPKKAETIGLYVVIYLAKYPNTVSFRGIPSQARVPFINNFSNTMTVKYEDTASGGGSSS